MNTRSLSVTIGTKVKKVLISLFHTHYHHICSITTLLIIYITYSSLLLGVHNQAVVALAAEVFPSTMPGLEKLISAGPLNQGSSFELESALVLGQKNEHVIGFDLAIAFEDNQACIAIDDRVIVLNSTEFDIVTDTLAIECKSGEHPSTIKCLKQLIKEQTMLAWMHSLAQDLKNGTLTIRVERRTHKTTFIALNGPSTRNRPIGLAVSWLENMKGPKIVEQLVSIIDMLATKHLVALFRATIPEEFKVDLTLHNIDFTENIDFASDF